MKKANYNTPKMEIVNISSNTHCMFSPSDPRADKSPIFAPERIWRD